MLWQYTRNSGHVLTYMTLKYLEQFTLRECKHVYQELVILLVSLCKNVRSVALSCTLTITVQCF